MVNMRFIRLVLFFGVLTVGMLAGFSIGYNSGSTAARSSARAAAMKFYDEFKANTAKGHIFSLWDFKVMPLGGKSVRICGNNRYLASAAPQAQNRNPEP